MHPSFQSLQQFIPFLSELSFPSLWGLLRFLEGLANDVINSQVSKNSFKDHLKKLVVEVASNPGDHSLLSVVSQFAFVVFGKQLVCFLFCSESGKEKMLWFLVVEREL